MPQRLRSFLDIIAKLSATHRRALRRARAKARLRWHLHRVGLRPLDPLALLRLRTILGAHHSRDLRLLARIQGEMSGFKPVPWRCRVCKKMAKPSMPRCAWCGKTWQEVLDTSYQPPPPQQQRSSPRRQNQGGNQYYQEQDHGGHQYGQGRTQTPRRKSRKGKRANAPQQSQLPHQHSGPPSLPSQQQYLPPGNWYPTGSMGPYPAPQGPPAFVQQCLAPPPPPPMPKAASVPPDQVWVQQMQQMPVLDGMNAVTMQPGQSSAQPSQAEKHLQNILGALRKSEEIWTPEVQQAVQEVSLQVEEESLQQVQNSAAELRHARKAVADAEAARLRLITSWRTFLQYSVARWKEYTQLFQGQETEAQTQLAAAKDQLQNAQKKFGKTSEAIRSGAGHHVNISDDDAEDGDKPSHDEEMKDETTQKIAIGLTQVVSSLQELSEHAEAEERKSKRLRKALDGEDGNGASKSFPSMMPFGKAGVQ